MHRRGDARATGPTTDIELRDDAARRSVRVGDEAVLTVRDRDDLLPAAMTEIDRASVAASADEVVLLHASAVLGADGPVLLIGPSGAGKSTLSAALTRRGWTYVGDEVIGLDEHATEAFANPKPWKLDRAIARRARGARGTVRASTTMRRNARSSSRRTNWARCTRPDRPDRRSRSSGWRFAPEPASDVSPLSRADGAELLADQCFNFARWERARSTRSPTLARRVPALHLEFGDLACRGRRPGIGAAMTGAAAPDTRSSRGSGGARGRRRRRGA